MSSSYLHEKKRTLLTRLVDLRAWDKSVGRIESLRSSYSVINIYRSRRSVDFNDLSLWLSTRYFVMYRSRYHNIVVHLVLNFLNVNLLIFWQMISRRSLPCRSARATVRCRTRYHVITFRAWLYNLFRALSSFSKCFNILSLLGLLNLFELKGSLQSCRRLNISLRFQSVSLWSWCCHSVDVFLLSVVNRCDLLFANNLCATTFATS